MLSVLTRQSPAASALTTAIALGKHAQWLRMSRIAHDPAALVGHNGVSRATEPERGGRESARRNAGEVRERGSGSELVDQAAREAPVQGADDVLVFANRVAVGQLPTGS